MRFQDIPGLSDQKKILVEAVRSNHAAHAQLFVGAEGALNLPMALAYATYLHCENRGDDDSCGTCAACSKNGKLSKREVPFDHTGRIAGSVVARSKAIRRIVGADGMLSTTQHRLRDRMKGALQCP